MILKKKLIVLLSLLFLCVSCTAETGSVVKEAIEEPTPQARMAGYIRELTSEEMAGRRVGTPGEAQAALYLAKYLRYLGVKPAGEGGTYFQAFTIGEIVSSRVDQRMTLKHYSEGKKVTSENVLGVIPGKSEEIVIISAHYDHLGRINDKLYPGANDNASGVALVMELAAALCEASPRNTVLLAFWGGEEAGLLGSSYYANNLTIPAEKIKCIINLDSIGNLKTDKKLLGWKSSEDPFSGQYINELIKAGWEINWENTTRHSSDHLSFAKKGIPGFTLLSPQWLKDNHTSDDTIDIVNFRLLAEIMDDLKKILI